VARVLLTAGLVTSLITADITSAQLVEIPGRVVPVGIMIFPIRNILGDVFLRPPVESDVRGGSASCATS